MNSMQTDVALFHQKFNHPIGDPANPQLPDPVGREFRVKLIQEEAQELCDAIQANDLPEAIDGACDLLYVVLGTFVAAGVDLQPFFNEVQRTNMLKVGAPGNDPKAPMKPLKPPGWAPPDMVKLLERYKTQAQKMVELRRIAMVNGTIEQKALDDIRKESATELTEAERLEDMYRGQRTTD